MNVHLVWLGLYLLLSFASVFQTVNAAEADELGAIRQEMQGMRKEMGEIRRLLMEMRQQLAAQPAGPQRPPQPPSIVKLNTKNGPTLGKADSPVTIVEFSDYQCPFCQRHARTTFAEIKRDYIDTGKVRYVFRDFPIDAIHPQARKASEAARCAAEQGRYWDMHDALFANQQMLHIEGLKNQAASLGLEPDAFATCLDQAKYAASIREDEKAGAAAGVTGTPTFFVGRTKADGVIDGARLVGAQPIAAFRRVIDLLLRE